MAQTLTEKADILMESLPYIRTFRSKTFVIKYGGSTMDEMLRKDIIQDVILLKYIGINPVIIHGGGSEITSYLNKLNLKSEFINGLRVTDKAAMEVVQMVLVGKINQEIVSQINKYGGKGVGLSGNDANIILVRKKLPTEIFDVNGNCERTVDYGYVADVEKIDPTILKYLSESGYIPVISPIGVSFDGESYNINADEAAGEIAQALKADKLIMLTDVDGIYEVAGNPATKIDAITIDKAREMIAKNQIKGGMIPKVKSCIEAILNGVKRTHIIDGRNKHSLLLEIFTDKGIGTMVIS
ncbi:MAG TPA: acetylglutamate kinase [Spirochaetota bacterium]|nr:MAG: Acetylglutamate kinase [Spirochaetes bacterium ADurb.Bin133]HNZ26423.1 acetylglutamate kinase [Spirochaetota bacterium]HPY87785.1 acetylglutamate kinase [Spirochaetota bacterium]HQB60948.1 acetylglutamate kinase [Spirochaetota bacterium]